MDRKPLRVLIAEDNPIDAELVIRELRRAGYNPESERVDTEEDFIRKLDQNIDIILSDYAMPQFTGFRALELLKEQGLDVPFILISGTIGEETAVAAMRDGAADYLLKDRLTRLGQAVEHALEEKRTREKRKTAEEKLQNLTRQHELILNSAGDGIFGLDVNGNIIFQNPKADELLRWKSSELLGKQAHHAIHYKKKDGNPHLIEASQIHATIRDGTTRKVTNDVFWRKDGTSFPVKYVSAPMKDDHGQIIGAIVVFNDVTAEIAAEARVKLQAQQYRLLFETNPNSMWVFDAETLRILAVNNSALTKYGYSREEFLQLTLNDLCLDQDLAGLRKAVSAPSTMENFAGEFRNVRKDGSQIVVAVYSSPLVWDGVFSRMVTAIDVTERKRDEARLREQAEIINRAHDAVVVRNFDDDRITFWNRGAERLYGWTAAEAIGRPMGELIFRDDKDRAAMVEQLVSTGEFHGEVRHRAKDDRDLVVDSRVTLIRDDEGKPSAVLGINTDVTEQKKLETQLLRAQRLESIGTLASGVAHDLNNVLTPILMASEFLRHKECAKAIESDLGLIEESARRGAAIVKQVLTFARGVQGERVLIKPNHLVDEMVDIARKTFPKSIDIDSKYSDDLWSIQGDPTQLHQVLLNLSVNGRDAMPNGGSLLFAAENYHVDENYAAMTPEAIVGPYVMFRVSDNGVGMPRSTIEKIFDPFFTTKEIGKGTGLGLSTAVGIIKSHGGFISVYSEVGKGTTFKVFLPAKVADQSSPAQTVETETLKGGGELVLVVDDEPNIVQVTQMVLENHNYRVVSAADGPEALAIFAQQTDSIALVLTDMMLPYMDGVSLIRAMKKLKPDTLFIASTGHGEQTRAGELETLGVREFLTKPYDTASLLNALRDTLAAQK